MTHTEESYAYRVSLRDGSGRGLVYSGDCGAADDLLPLLRPGDVLLSEASFGPRSAPEGRIHLGGPDVGRVARQAGASEVLLTHMLARYDRARDRGCGIGRVRGRAGDRRRTGRPVPAVASRG